MVVLLSVFHKLSQHSFLYINLRFQISNLHMHSIFHSTLSARTSLHRLFQTIRVSYFRNQIPPSSLPDYKGQLLAKSNRNINSSTLSRKRKEAWCLLCLYSSEETSENFRGKGCEHLDFMRRSVWIVLWPLFLILLFGVGLVPCSYSGLMGQT